MYRFTPGWLLYNQRFVVAEAQIDNGSVINGLRPRDLMRQMRIPGSLSVEQLIGMGSNCKTTRASQLAVQLCPRDGSIPVCVRLYGLGQLITVVQKIVFTVFDCRGRET